jgi:serine/threonine protein kinase
LIHFNLSLFVSLSLSFWLNWMCETDWNWQSTQIDFVELIVLYLGFWGVTNSCEIRRRKSKYSFIWNVWIEIESKNDDKVTNLCDWFQTKSGVGPVCWMAPESIATRNYSKKSDVWTFGIVDLWIFQFFYCFTIWCDNFFVLMSLFSSIIEKFVCLICLFVSVYEIVAQCEPHKDKNVIDIAVSIRWVNEFMNSTHQTLTSIELIFKILSFKFQFEYLTNIPFILDCLFVWFLKLWRFVDVLFVCLFDVLWFEEMKDWHQQFQMIVLQFFEKWCKCVGRKTLINVLYPSLSPSSISWNISIISRFSRFLDQY